MAKSKTRSPEFKGEAALDDSDFPANALATQIPDFSSAPIAAAIAAATNGAPAQRSSYRLDLSTLSLFN